jgi:GAG-pre-integrase domain
MISEGSMVNGLYVLKLDQLTFSTVNAASSQLWHKRSGHPSDRVLKHLNLSLIHDFSNCELCQFAKLHRLQFPILTNLVMCLILCTLMCGEMHL